MEQLKWREVITANVLVGGVSSANLSAIPATDAQGNTVDGFSSFTRTPYVEVGYGIDNIFKVLRVDFLHRLTYRDNLTRTGVPGTTFAIKFSGWLSF